MNLPIDTLFSLIDFLAVFVGALGGALAAVRDTRYKFDLVGVTGLAMASALGGGITRDLILQKGPPLAFADPRYLGTRAGGRRDWNAVRPPDWQEHRAGHCDH